MLRILLIFIVLSAQPLFLISKRKQRFETALPVCCMLDMLILMFFGMVFKNLTAGIIAVFGLAAGSLISTLILERKNLKKLCENVMTPGFYAWAVGYCLMWAFSYKQFFIEWDTFMHWGPFVEQMFIHNKLYTEPDVSILIHKNYPPIISLFEFMFTKIWGSYSEAVIFAAFRISQYICVLPFTLVFAKKENIKAIVLGLTAYFYLMTFVTFDTFNYSIMVDAHLSFLFTLYIYFAVFDRNNPLQKINCAIIGIALTLTKVSGIAFALVGMTIYAIIKIMDMKNSNDNHHIHIGKKLFKIVTHAVWWALPIASYFIWKVYTKNIASELLAVPAGEGGTSNGIFGIFGIFDTFIQWFTLNGGEIKNNVLSASAYLWLTMKMTSGWLPVYNLVIMIGFIVMMYCLKMTEKNKNISRCYTVLMIILPIGYLAYSLSLTAINLMNNALIDKGGGWGVSSFNRYLASYAGGMGLILLAIVIRTCANAINDDGIVRKLISHILPIFVLVLLPPMVFQYLAPLGEDGYDAFEYKNYTRTVQKTDAFMTAINEKNAKIYFVYCDNKGIDELNFWKNQYWLKPIKINNVGYLNVLTGDEPLSPYSQFDSDAEWGLSLAENEFTHVLLYHADEPFKNRFSKMFDCSYEQIKDDTLYEIVVDGEQDLKLIPMTVPVYRY